VIEEALGFFRVFEVWIYLLIALGGLFYIRRFALAWQELRGAAFGLERENAQGRLNHSASVLVLLIAMAVTEFVLVSFVAPTIPGATPLPTPTLDLLATPTITLPATTPLPGEATAAPLPTGLSASGCVPAQVEIFSPAAGQEVVNVVVITGTVNIPNFGFYKLEMKRPDEAIWATIQAGNEIRMEGKLGDWDTRRLPPGDYQLGLVVVDNEARALPPCVVQVRVGKAPEETPGP